MIFNEEIKKAVCQIKCGKDEGTAFLIAESIAITSAHCVENYESSPIELTFVNLSSEKVEASVLFYEESFDIAIFGIKKAD